MVANNVTSSLIEYEGHYLDPLVLWVNISLIIVILITLRIAVKYDVFIFWRFFRGIEKTEEFSKVIDEIRQSLRQYTSVSGILAAISLATTAFISQIIIENNRIEGIIGIIFMVSASILFFWSLGLSFNGSIPSKNYDLTKEAFRRADQFVTFGVYIFFIGLLWSISIIHYVITLSALVTYLIVFAYMFQIREKKKNSL